MLKAMKKSDTVTTRKTHFLPEQQKLSLLDSLNYRIILLWTRIFKNILNFCKIWRENIVWKPFTTLLIVNWSYTFSQSFPSAIKSQLTYMSLKWHLVEDDEGEKGMLNEFLSLPLPHTTGKEYKNS